MEGALGHTGEHLHHGVTPQIVICVYELEHLGAIGHEDAPKEGVHEVHLPDYIDKVEDVTKKILKCIGVMHSPGLPEVVDQIVTSIPSLILVKGLTPEATRDFIQLLVLKGLPDVVRNVEHDPLQEQHEGHPLVVGMHHSVPLIISFWPHPLVRKVLPLFSFVLGGYGEGGHDPAVGVQHIARHIVIDAGNGRANQVIGGD